MTNVQNKSHIVITFFFNIRNLFPLNKFNQKYNNFLCNFLYNYSHSKENS